MKFSKLCVIIVIIIMMMMMIMLIINQVVNALIAILTENYESSCCK